ncbi:MAG: hypothetical protein ASARMPRED_009185 [Alectoria sarmentosa]|nr:MAG: hypothetical protein ASARMPRED_009185 [Alectoria sarmentosa]
MAVNQGAVSFDEIIQAGRQRKEKEKLANDILGQGRREKQRLAEEIFGRGRSSNGPNNGSRKSGAGPSLASRVGVAKASQRSSSTPKASPSMDGTWGHDRAPRITRPPRGNPMARQAKDDLLYNTAVTQPPRNGVAVKGLGEEISIRGTAGPYVVVGSNFAPGTTAADIESAMIPSGGEMQSCRIISSTPTVMAEMVFAEKCNAESVISTFNNKKADGRILYVYMKVGGPTPSPASAPLRKTPIEPRAPRIDLTHDPAPSYDTQREQSDRNRRRADPEFQDGSYGFVAREDVMDVDMDVPRSDAPVSDVPHPDTSRSDAPRLDVPRSERRDDRRDDRRDGGRDERRDDRRDARYDVPSDYGRGRSYIDRDRDGGRPRNDQRLYSDNMYPRPRGRGFR